MSTKQDAPRVASLRDLYAIAYQIEADAAARYEMLAAQMETHNNPELAYVFRDLARAEGIHAAEIERLASGGQEIREHALAVAKWQRTESPEAADLAEAHYLMTRADALRMALAGEERAFAFYQNLLQTTTDPEMKKLAAHFAEEEAEHVELCHRLIRKYQEADGPGDSDPALAQD
jgi:rubrerythrin